MLEKEKNQSVKEMFVPLYEARFYGEAAQMMEGTMVEILGRRLGDGSDAGRHARYSQMGIRITGDVEQLEKKAKELRDKETWENIDKL